MITINLGFEHTTLKSKQSYQTKQNITFL